MKHSGVGAQTEFKGKRELSWRQPFQSQSLTDGS